MNSSPTPTQRIQSVDLLRGVVMMVMALDHVRDFFHWAAMSGSATDLATTRNARASADHRSERVVGELDKGESGQFPGAVYELRVIHPEPCLLDRYVQCCWAGT